MADGTDLAYTVVRPGGRRSVPDAVRVLGLQPRPQPDAGYIDRFVEGSGHYAYVGVNLRGTGCSEGTFDFFQPQEAKDGAAVVEWITEQSWSDGHVGMIGKSYPGITQLFVAAEDPDGLDAIAPGHFFADAYRDVARPGGIANHGFATLWSFIARPSYEVQDSPQYVLDGDYGCTNGLTSEFRSLHTNPYVQLLQHPYDDALTAERSPGSRIDDLLDADIPMLATLAWQDEQLASRQTHLLAALDDARFDLVVGDAHQRRPRHVAHRAASSMTSSASTTTSSAARTTAGTTGRASRCGGRPGATRASAHPAGSPSSTTGRRPSAAAPMASWRRGRCAAIRRRAHRGARRRRRGVVVVPYVPIAGSQGVGNPAYGYPDLPNRYLWDVPPPEGTAAAFTTAPMAEDVTLLGSASLDLWLSAASTDVDLQVTLTEVRPDGQEEFVQQGWLRASQRALDPARSTELLPVPDPRGGRRRARSTPGEPVLARVEVFPFGHVLREGSRLRVWVEAPTFLPQLWAFTPTPVPTPVTVLHDADHPSRLVLPRVPNDPERIAALPECGLVIRQPCRPDPLAAERVGTTVRRRRWQRAPGRRAEAPSRSAGGVEACRARAAEPSGHRRRHRLAAGRAPPCCSGSSPRHITATDSASRSASLVRDFLRLRIAWLMRCSFSMSANRQNASPSGPKPTPGDVATWASRTSIEQNSMLPISW